MSVVPLRPEVTAFSCHFRLISANFVDLDYASILTCKYGLKKGVASFAACFARPRRQRYRHHHQQSPPFLLCKLPAWGASSYDS